MAIRSNQIPTNKEWRFLTIFGSKKRYFNTETYFRESWFDGYSIAGDQLLNKLVRTAVVIFKPEVFATDKTKSIVKLIEKYDFKFKSAYITKFNKFKIREVWRYQYSEATIDRMELVDNLYCLGDALFMFFEDTSSHLDMPTSARLHRLKGASEERLRSKDSLRSIIKIPNGVIRFFHISDEPADIIREIGIMFNREERLKIYKDLINENCSIKNEELFMTISSLEKQHPKTSFNVDECWEKVLKHPDYNATSGLLDLKSAFDNGIFVGWNDIYIPLRKINMDIYDILTIASHMIQQDVDDEFHLIDGDALRGWKDRNLSQF